MPPAHTACSNAATSDGPGDGDRQTKLWPKHEEAANMRLASNRNIFFQPGNTHLASSF
jgi:hypothetical protein